jgi:hypothetical protein
MEIRELGIMVWCSIWIIDSAASNALRKTDRAGVYKFFKFQPRGIFNFFQDTKQIFVQHNNNTTKYRNKISQQKNVISAFSSCISLATVACPRYST